MNDEQGRGRFIVKLAVSDRVKYIFFVCSVNSVLKINGGPSAEYSRP
jgi:hypothetical protein